jgi:tetratricopeptide (TPR) repeat protein
MSDDFDDFDDFDRELGDNAIPIGDQTDRILHLLNIGQVDRARDLAVELVAHEPEDENSHCVLACVLYDMGKNEQSLKAAQEAIRLAPDSDRCHLFSAQALTALGRFAAAEASILEALALDPAEPNNHLFYARLLHINGKPLEALDATEQALEFDADDADAHALRAQLLLEVSPSKWKLSEDAVRRALYLDPEDADAHAILGHLQLRTGKRDEAEASFRSCLELDPSNGLGVSGLAQVVMGKAPLYRPFLSYSIWMDRLSVGARVAFIAGLWVLFVVLRQVFRDNDQLAGLAGPLSIVYLSFCAYTWFAEPITKLILRRHYSWLRDA